MGGAKQCWERQAVTQECGLDTKRSITLARIIIVIELIRVHPHRCWSGEHVPRS
jgi:hypothetical protein